MDIFAYFRNKEIDTLDKTFYRRIEVWRSWYNSNVRRFHRYKVYRGNGTVPVMRWEWRKRCVRTWLICF